ncbi:TPA: MFS transporter [Candidatus Bathyarchaeota archaeon]|nr:MFS transporter [Candidatus Bathyarchaeota archaeon]
MKRSTIYSASVIVLSLTSLIENLAGALPSSYFPYYAISLGAEMQFIGIFIAAFMATSATLSSPLGSLSDRIGRKKLIQAGLLGDVFLGTLTGLAPNWQILLVLRAFNGVATAAVRPAAEASLIDQVPEDRRGEALGFFLTLTMIGWFLGPIFGGTIQYISENLLGFPLEESYRIPFFVDSLLSIIAMGLIAWKVRETRGEKAAYKRAEDTAEDEGIKLEGWVKRSIKILYVTTLTNGFAVGFIAPVGVLFLGEVFEAIPFQIGGILSISGFTGIICNFFAGKLADKWGRKLVIAIGSLSSRIASIILPFTSDLIQATTIMAFRSLGINVSMPAGRALRADLVPGKIRGKLFGIFNALFDVGMITGVLLGPLLFYEFRFQNFIIERLNLSVRGVGAPFFISGFMGLLALAILLAFVKEPKRKTKNRTA